MALVLGFAVTNRMSVLERVIGARLVPARALWGATLIAGTVAAAQCAGLAAAPEWRIPAVRNGLALAGVALLGAAPLGARLAWLPVFAWTAVTVLAGRGQDTGAVRSWALLLAPGSSGPALAAAVVVAVSGLAVYARWDSRPTRGVAGE
jgi:hypothetical protein